MGNKSKVYNIEHDKGTTLSILVTICDAEDNPDRAGWTQEQKDAFIEKRTQQYNRIKELEKELGL